MNSIEIERPKWMPLRIAESILDELPFFLIFILLNFGLDFSSFRSVFSNLTFLLFLASLLTVFVVHKRPAVIKWTIYALSFVAFSVELFSKLNLDLSICPRILMLIAETNGEESKGFFTTFAEQPSFIATVLILVALIALTIYLERNYGKWRDGLKFNGITFVVLVSLVTIGVYPAMRLGQLFFTDNTDELTIWYGKNSTTTLQTNILQSIWTLHLSSKETESMIASNKNIANMQISAPSDTLDLVLVIGESFIKKHSSLYGYPLKTNPLLEKEREAGRLVCFDSVSGVSNMTSTAVRNMLCTNSLADGRLWHQSLYAPAIFKRAGYDVFYWNNQMDLEGSVWSFSLNALLYDEDMKAISYTACNDTVFPLDGLLVDYFEQLPPKSESPRVLTMFHLNGQHFNPKSRYPAEKAYFSADSIQRDEHWMTDRIKRKISEYDNATRYNDYVMKRIISLYENKNAILVYLSDHGDEAFDYRAKNGRPSPAKGWEREFEEYNINVPMMIWASDKYRASHPERWAQVASVAERRFSSDCLPHLLFALGDVTTSEYDARHDILSDSYAFEPVDFWPNVK